MLRHWLCLVIKFRQLKFPLIKLLDGFVWIQKFTGQSLNVQQWQTDQKWEIKKSRKYFLYGCDNAHRISGLNTLQLFGVFFRYLCVDIHVIPCLSFIAVVQRLPWYMYNFICENSLFSSAAWLFTCALSVYGFMPCSGILFNSYNNFIQFKKQGIN